MPVEYPWEQEIECARQKNILDERQIALRTRNFSATKLLLEIANFQDVVRQVFQRLKTNLIKLCDSSETAISGGNFFQIITSYCPNVLINNIP